MNPLFAISIGASQPVPLPPPYTSDRGYYRHGILGAIRVFDTRTNIRAAVSVIVQVANGRANICGRLVTCVELSLTEQVT